MTPELAAAIAGKTLQFELGVFPTPSGRRPPS
jgi:hypothetical protein